MLNENELRQIPLTALFIAAGIILPQFFHLIGLGAMFLPMFLPVYAGSMILTWRFALALAVFCPLISWLFTGMPPVVPPILPIIVTELIVIALTASLIRVHFNRSVWTALFAAILADRLVLFLMVTAIAPLFGLKHPLFSVSLLASGLPGIVLQIITIPALYKFITIKYPNYLEFTRK